MTLTQAETLVRLYSRLSTCTISTTELDLYIQRANLKTALEILELFPSASGGLAFFTWPANSFTKALDSTLIPALSTRSIHKVWGLGTYTSGGTTPNSWTWWSPCEPQELAGYDGPRDLRRDTATVQRWLWAGSNMHVYPLLQADQTCVIGYNLIPVLMPTGATALWADFPKTIQQYDELVVWHATVAMLRDRGMNTDSAQAQLTAYDAMVKSHCRALQQQESPALLGDRYQTKAVI